jgi:hypothetical protein
VEVYRSGMDAPIAFTGGRPESLPCGVIVFWTR